MAKSKLVFVEIAEEDLKEIFKRCPDLQHDGMTLYFGELKE